MNKKFLLTLPLLLLTALSFAQGSEPADFMRSTGKVYVVVAVIIVIFIGIVLFLIYLDRKLTKLENQIKNED